MRAKAAQNCKILPGLSAKSDCKEGRFLQVGNSLLFDEGFCSLPHGARLLYLCMTLECGGKRDFVFPLAAAKKYKFTEASFRRYVKLLVAAGFIEVQSNANLRKPNNYRFSFRWKETRPP